VDRARDLRDILILDIGQGFFAAEVDARATDYLTFCVGAAESRRIRLLGKLGEAPVVEGKRWRVIEETWFGPVRNEANIGFPVTNLAGLLTEGVSPACTWLSVPEFLDMDSDVTPYVKNWLIVDDYEHKKPLTEKFDVTLGFSVPFATARVGVSPGNLVDFFAGWIGLDPAGDDER
jgi:hypothetical protein